MNCPKCDTRCYVGHPHGKPEDSRLMCPDCGWESDTLENLVTVTAATMTARAENAEAQRCVGNECKAVRMVESAAERAMNREEEAIKRAEKAEALASRSQSFIAAICAEELGRGCDGCQETKCPNHPAEGDR